MTAPRYARLAARVLGNAREAEVAHVDAVARTHAAAGRSAAVEAIERALREKGRRRARVRWTGGLAAAAAVLALAAGGVHAARDARHGTVVSSASSVPSAAQEDGARVASSAPSPQAGEQSDSLPGAALPMAALVGKSGGNVSVTAPGSSAKIADGKPLAAGSRIVARAGGRALLAFATGTRLAVEEGSDMTIVEEGPTQVFSLAGGAVRADVAKLDAGQRFVIRTADAEVEVRGTSFRVAVAPSDASCGGGTTTRVAVYEGAVVVRNAGIDWTVAKGESWPMGCTAPHGSGRGRAGVARARGAGASAGAGTVASASGSVTSAAPSTALAPVTPDAPAATDERRVGAVGAMNTEAAGPSPARASSGSPSAPLSAPAPAPAPPSTSKLAEQNDRFSAAIAAKRSGDTAGAIAAFERFAAAYPASPLAESALVERMKLVASIDRARGAAAARQYLARYPGGFARADAEALAAESK